MTFTHLEAQVFNLMVRESMAGGVLDTADIAEALSLPLNTVKGVLGSLTKKGKVDPDEGDEFKPAVVWPVHPEHGPCFWGDFVSRSEAESLLITASA